MDNFEKEENIDTKDGLLGDPVEDRVSFYKYESEGTYGPKLTKIHRRQMRGEISKEEALAEIDAIFLVEKKKLKERKAARSTDQ